MEKIDIQNTLYQYLGYLLIGLTLAGFLAAIFYSSQNSITPRFTNTLFLLPFVFFLFPYIAISLYRYYTVFGKMKSIPRYLRDIVDNIEGGMDLISAIHTGVKTDYLNLNDDILKLSNRLHWGINLYTALDLFAKDINDKQFMRDFQLIIQAQKIGGNVKVILKELSEKISIELLRLERRKRDMSSLIATGYISFSIFIFIIVLLFSSLFTSMVYDGAGNNAELSQDRIETYNQNLILFLILSYELAILSGFLFGVMSTGSLIRGGPHVVFLVLIVYGVFLFSFEFGIIEEFSTMLI